ncbi:MAG: hypothetical protein KF690_09590 [Bacteroidetes bacterium]|nr:hypothetical protein [Bacteroidota bacterium]
MKNYAPRALAGILLAQVLLLLLGGFYPDIKEWQSQYVTEVQVGAHPMDLRLKFQTTEQMFAWLPRQQQMAARKQLGNLLKKKPFDPLRPDVDPNGVGGEAAAKIYNPVDGDRHALDNFFLALHHLRQQPQPLRISHYGDSQIEGDRMSVFLRYFFQQKFGGYGIGYVPMTEPATSQNFLVREHTDFVRYSVFHNHVKDGRYHLSGNVWRLPKDQEEGFYTFKLAPGVGYGQLKLLWGNAALPWEMSVRVQDSLVYTDTLWAAEGFQMTPVRLPSGAREATLTFRCRQSPDFYGLLFDGGGVTVDNYAIRGHAGNGLLTINSSFMQTQYAQLNTKLVILQYGGNVVPYTDVKDFGWLEQANYNLIRKFQALLPQASVLVIGVGDAAYKDEDGNWDTYPTVPLIRNAQKRAASRAKAAFWDLWMVMGGQGAILEWVKQEPPLAGEDYAHLTWHGQKLIARELFGALMVEYEAFERRLAATAQRKKSPQPPVTATAQAQKP